MEGTEISLNLSPSPPDRESRVALLMSLREIDRLIAANLWGSGEEVAPDLDIQLVRCQ